MGVSSGIAASGVTRPFQLRFFPSRYRDILTPSLTPLTLASSCSSHCCNAATSGPTQPRATVSRSRPDRTRTGNTHPRTIRFPCNPPSPSQLFSVYPRHRARFKLNPAGQADCRHKLARRIQPRLILIYILLLAPALDFQASIPHHVYIMRAGFVNRDGNSRKVRAPSPDDRPHKFPMSLSSKSPRDAFARLRLQEGEAPTWSSLAQMDIRYIYNRYRVRGAIHSQESEDFPIAIAM